MRNHKYNADEYTPDDVQPDPIVPQVDDSYWEGGDSNCDYFVDLLAENVVDYVIKKKEDGDE